MISWCVRRITEGKGEKEDRLRCPTPRLPRNHYLLSLLCQHSPVDPRTGENPDFLLTSSALDDGSSAHGLVCHELEASEVYILNLLLRQRIFSTHPELSIHLLKT